MYSLFFSSFLFFFYELIFTFVFIASEFDLPYHSLQAMTRKHLAYNSKVIENSNRPVKCHLTLAFVVYEHSHSLPFFPIQCFVSVWDTVA